MKSKNLEVLFVSLLPYLSVDDLKSCRLLNSTWKTFVEKVYRFARICSDTSIGKLTPDNLNDTQLSIRVENLQDPVIDSQIHFASKVTLLFFEPFPTDHFEDKENGSHENSKALPTVSFSNLMKILWSCCNVQRLILNQGALAHAKIDNSCFEGISNKLVHLRHLGVILSSYGELRSLRHILNETFPKLEFLSVCYRNIRYAETLDHYVEILMFILKHKATLRDIVLSDPPMVPQNMEVLRPPPVPPKKHRAGKNKKPRKPQNSINNLDGYLELFRNEFSQLNLHGIGLKFMENVFSCWGLGMTILENRTNLVLVYLAKIPAMVAERVAWENSATIQVFNLKGLPFDTRSELSKVFNCSCLANCHHLFELELSDFYRYKNVNYIPFKRLRVLHILTYIGSNPAYGSEPLCSYETAVNMCTLLKKVEKLTLFRASMVTCQLARLFCQLESLQEITLMGFNGHTEKFHVLRHHVQPQPPTKHNYILEHNNSELKPMALLAPQAVFREEVKFCQNNIDDCEKMYKMCSDASLCPSCVKIMFPKSRRRTRWDRLSSGIRLNIYSFLNREDLCYCRLVSRSWSDDVVKYLQFGFSLSDRTKDTITETGLTRIVYLAVANLRSIIPYENLYFARYVQTLVLEYNEEAFISGNLNVATGAAHEDILESFPEESITMEKAFGVSKEPSIHSRNIINLLETTYNLETLFINQWALSNLLGPNRTVLKQRLFQKLAYKNLRCLHFVVHAGEAEAMTQFLSLDFHYRVIELEKFSVQFVGSPKARCTMDVYESLFKFIGWHSGSLQELKIIDPVFVSEASKARGDIEPSLAMVSDKCKCGCVKIFPTSTHLRKLTLIFKDCSSKWNLGFVFIRAQKFLAEIWLDGLPINEVHTVILNNANTLQSIYVSGPANMKKKNIFNFDYTKNCHSLKRLTVKNSEVENTQEIPEGIRSLEIHAFKGNTVWNISPTLSRVRGKVTITAKLARVMTKQFDSLEKLALIHVGVLTVDLMKLFLKLPRLKVVATSEIQPEVIAELKSVFGVKLVPFVFSNGDVGHTTVRPPGNSYHNGSNVNMGQSSCGNQSGLPAGSKAGINGSKQVQSNGIKIEINRKLYAIKS